MRLFGTDGVRGIVNKDLDIFLATKIGVSAAYVLGKNKKIKVVIGRDTRISGEMLSFAVTSGLLSMGAEVIDLGIVPTPLVSYLIQKYNADMGVMISASHNPSEYNGIKLFNEFKNMPLGKQSLIATATIALIITFLSNYKTIKNGSKSVIEKFTQDENIKEFMEDVNKVLQSFSGVCKKFANGETNEEKSE